LLLISKPGALLQAGGCRELQLRIGVEGVGVERCGRGGRKQHGECWRVVKDRILQTIRMLGEAGGGHDMYQNYRFPQ
jgi:hypothetical protein